MLEFPFCPPVRWWLCESFAWFAVSHVRNWGYVERLENRDYLRDVYITHSWTDKKGYAVDRREYNFGQKELKC